MTWQDDFKVDTSITKTSISQIERFMIEVMNRGRLDDNLSDRKLQEKFENVDLHFIVDTEDPEGKHIMNSMDDIAVMIQGKTNAAEYEFWLRSLMQLSLMMAGRLVTYRQDIDPSTALTASLHQFVSGLKGFVDLHATLMAKVDKTQWKGLMKRMNEGREKVVVATLKWKKKLLKAASTPLALIEDSGVGIAEDLKYNRKNRQPDSAAKIVDLEDLEVSILSELRSRLERAIEKRDDSQGKVLLHRSKTHLFSAKTYGAATNEIDAVLGARPEERHQLVLVMQKKFELLALHELVGVLKSATACYAKIGDLLESSKEIGGRCTSAIEQVVELYWLQRRTMNINTAEVEVDIPRFRKYIRFLVRGASHPDPADPAMAARGNVNADMWTPSLLKLEDMCRADLVPVDSIQYVYDAILIPFYHSPLSTRLISTYHAPDVVTPRLTTVTPFSGSTISVLPKALSVTGSTGTASKKDPKKQKFAVASKEEIAFSIIGSSVHAQVVKQRDIVRSLVRIVVAKASKVMRAGASLHVEGDLEKDVGMGTFSEILLLPYLEPITELWSSLEDYLKPLTPDHEDKDLLSGAKNKARERAIQSAASDRGTPRESLDNVASSLSSSSTFILQIIKVFRLFMQIGAAFVAQKVFNESYVRKVFSEGRDPPMLTSMLYLMLSIDATAHLMLVLVLVLASFAFKTDDNHFIVDDLFLSDVLTEFATSSLVLTIMGMMIADTMRRKRYFQYADQGQVVSAAYRSALLYVCVVNFVVPFSVLIS